MSVEHDEGGLSVKVGAKYEHVTVEPIESMVALEAVSWDTISSLVLNREDALAVALHIIRILRATA